MIKIPVDSKILNISHNDIDGSVCSIILAHVFKNIKIVDMSFYRIDEALESLKFKDYDYVILTDIHPKKLSSLELSDNIILIDHHKSAEEYHNPAKNRFVIVNKGCATILVKHWVEKIYKVNLNSLKNLIYLTNDYDTWQIKNPKSKMMADLQFHLYRPKKFIEEFFNGRTKLTTNELIWLKDRKESFKKLCENLEIYDLDKIKGCYVEATDFINEVADALIKRKGYDLVFVRNPNSNKVSVRHNIKNLDVGKILKDLDLGGGHADAAGFKAFQNEVQDKIILIENKIVEVLKND
jgi:oligoribonuclease NrnB/cAMP/cGMP phosphodiesterase (DHH superfamily)